MHSYTPRCIQMYIKHGCIHHFIHQYTLLYIKHVNVKNGIWCSYVYEILTFEKLAYHWILSPFYLNIGLITMLSSKIIVLMVCLNRPFGYFWSTFWYDRIDRLIYWSWPYNIFELTARFTWVDLTVCLGWPFNLLGLTFQFIQVICYIYPRRPYYSTV